MKKPRYKIGDPVECRLGTFRIIKMRSRRSTKIEQLKHTFPSTWVYQVSDGHSWYWSESSMKSKIKCPNCGNEGYEHVTGCNYCGLSPADYESVYDMGGNGLDGFSTAF